MLSSFSRNKHFVFNVRCKPRSRKNENALQQGYILSEVKIAHEFLNSNNRRSVSERETENSRKPGGTTQSVCVSVSKFIVNALDLPFASS